MHVSNGTFICDNCKKVIEQWSVVQIVKRQYSTGDNLPVNYYPDGFSRILRVSFDLTTMDGGQ